MNEECETCIKRKTVYCPNSIECMATDDKPYYQNRIMLLEENQELKLELSGYRQAILEDKDMLGLKEESEELKKQLEDISEELELVRCDLHNRTSERDGRERELDECLSQQKEFIKYLENEIKKIQEQIKNYDIWHEVGTDINFLILKKQFNIEILLKYKEIIGD